MNIPEECKCPFGNDTRSHPSFHVLDGRPRQTMEQHEQEADTALAYRKDKITELRAASVV